jgi:hypothetical protein
MQMGFDFQDGAQGLGSLAETGVFAGPWGLPGRPAADGFAPGGVSRSPDWLGLKARFAALHALRRTIDSSPAPVIPAGSFMAAGEAVLASVRDRAEVVNRICSGNGKAAAGMIALLSPTVPREATEDTND